MQKNKKNSIIQLGEQIMKDILQYQYYYMDATLATLPAVQSLINENEDAKRPGYIVSSIDSKFEKERVESAYPCFDEVFHQGIEEVFQDLQGRKIHPKNILFISEDAQVLSRATTLGYHTLPMKGTQSQRNLILEKRLHNHMQKHRIKTIAFYISLVLFFVGMFYFSMGSGNDEIMVITMLIGLFGCVIFGGMPFLINLLD